MNKTPLQEKFPGCMKFSLLVDANSYPAGTLISLDTDYGDSHPLFRINEVGTSLHFDINDIKPFEEELVETPLQKKLQFEVGEIVEVSDYRDFSEFTEARFIANLSKDEWYREWNEECPIIAIDQTGGLLAWGYVRKRKTVLIHAGGEFHEISKEIAIKIRDSINEQLND